MQVERQRRMCFNGFYKTKPNMSGKSTVIEIEQNR